MKVHRFLMAAMAGTICFAVVSVVMLNSLCDFGNAHCDGGSPFQAWLIVWFWVCAILILGVTLALQVAVRHVSFYRQRLMLLLYPVVAICVPKLWALLTGSGFAAIRSWSVLDAVFGTSGFVMGLVLYVIWRQWPNYALKRTVRDEVSR